MSAVLADSPLVYYRLADQSFSGLMADSSGNGRDGAWAGNAAWMTMAQNGLLPNDQDKAWVGAGGWIEFSDDLFGL